MCVAFYGNQSQSYKERHLPHGFQLPISYIRHTWTLAALTLANQAGTRFTYREGMEGWDC